MAGERRALARAAALVVLAACSSGPGVTSIQTAFNKGVYHHSRGELAEAVAEYREALADDPRDWRARSNLAMALDDQGRAHRAEGRPDAAATAFAAAVREYEMVLLQHPGDARASVNLAALEYERADVGAAKARLLGTIEANPDLALPRVALALRLVEEGDLERAKELLAAALAVEPTDVGANLLQGQVMARLGAVDEARAAYGAALGRAPDDPGVLVALARLELGAGRDNEALVRLRQVALQHPRRLDAHLLLADLHERRGELEDAVFHLWQARGLDLAAPRQGDYGLRLRALYERLLQAETGR